MLRLKYYSCHFNLSNSFRANTYYSFNKSSIAYFHLYKEYPGYSGVTGPSGAIPATQAPRAEPAFMVGSGFRSIRGYISTVAPRAQLAFIGWSLCPTEWLELRSSSFQWKIKLQCWLIQGGLVLSWTIWQIVHSGKFSPE